MTLLASRAVTPVVMGLFALFYVGVASFNDEALVTVIALTRTSNTLLLLLLLIPVNILAVLVKETVQYLVMRQALQGRLKAPADFHYDESVQLAGDIKAELLESQLTRAGYNYRSGEGFYAAWKGIPVFPARVLFLLGSLLLFSGILLNITTRNSIRQIIVEGEPLPEAVMTNGRVEQILLQERVGLVLARTLAIDVAVGERQSQITRLGLYPPGKLNGFFLYPRYLGLAPLIKFTPPEPGPGFESYITLMIYPPGKEDGAEIPGSPYKIYFSLRQTEAEDPFVSGKFALDFKVLKDKEVVAEGMVPVGGTVSSNGYSLAFPDAKRLVVTDFVRDAGLPLIWSAGFVFTAALLLYLPIKLCAPHREIFFIATGEATRVCSRAEGKGKQHRSLLHNLLDLLFPGQ